MPQAPAAPPVDFAARDRDLPLDFNALAAAYAASGHRPLQQVPTGPHDQAQIARFDAFLAARGGGDSYDWIHGRRFRETVARFGDLLQQARSVVELGGHSRIGVFAESAYGVTYTGYESELRDPFDLPDASCDVVLCLEVLEHIKDVPALETTIERIASFTYSGVMNLLRESFRILKPGGRLLITTPNSTSVDVILGVMRAQHTMLFEPHVREMAPGQVKAFGELAGFTLERFGTFFAWDAFPQEERDRMLGVMAELGHDPSHRGDDAYYVFRKPA